MSPLLKTDIGTIAPNWEVVDLGAIAEKPQYGLTAKSEEKGSVKFLRITDINEWGVDWELVPYCDCPESQLEKYLLKSGDIVFARIGATTGKSYIIKNPPEAVFASYLIRVRTKQDIDPNFLIYFFRSNGYWKQVDANKHANLKKGVNGSVLRSLLLPKPPLPEQKKIAYILSTVQKAIEQQEKIIATTTELKKALMHKLFTEGLHGEPQKETEIGLVPESWEVVPLGQISKIGNGSTPQKSNPAYWNDGSIPWLTSAKIHEGVIKDSNQFVTDVAIKECHLPEVKSGSLLIAITGQGKTLGNTAIVTFDTRISQHLAYAQFNNDNVVPYFILTYMQSRYEHFRQISQGGGSTKGALTCGFLKTYPVPIPSKEEQIEIAKIFELLEQKIRNYNRKLVFLKDLFRTLLHQLMTAQIRVNDIDLGELKNLEAA